MLGSEDEEPHSFSWSVISWAMVVVLPAVICNYDPHDLPRSQMFLMGNWRGELLCTISEEWKWNSVGNAGGYKRHPRTSECIMWLFRVWWVLAPSLSAYEQSCAHSHENQFHKSWLLINAFLQSKKSIKIEPRHLFVLLCETLKGTVHFPYLGTHCYRMYLTPETEESQKREKWP